MRTVASHRDMCGAEYIFGPAASHPMPDTDRSKTHWRQIPSTHSYALDPADNKAMGPFRIAHGQRVKEGKLTG